MSIVVLEGLDAAGKATQSKLLVDRIQRTGRGAVLYSFPRYETPLGHAIKRHLIGYISVREEHSIDSSDIRIDGDTVYRQAPEDALIFQCMMTADKYDAAVDMNTHLRAGRIVVCDRWTPSALVYGTSDGLSSAWINRVQELLPKGDINIFIDVPEEEALKRRPKLRDRYETNRELQIRVRENYRTMWAVGGPNWQTVDGVGTIEEVQERIWSAVRKYVIEISAR